MKHLLLKLAGLALVATSLHVAAAGEVSLLKVQTTFTFSRQANYSGRFEAVVANLGYQKQVYIHIKQKNGTWTDLPLSYNRPASAGKEVWLATYYGLPTDAASLEFAVKYQVNGQTFWDNNNNANYKAESISGTQLVGTPVYAGEDRRNFDSNFLRGAVSLKNLGFAKQVNVIYSTNNWATTQTAAATFSSDYWSGLSITNPNAYGFEEWTFALDVGTATQVAYAISYTVNGQTYWDNNFGHNYTLTR